MIKDIDLDYNENQMRLGKNKGIYISDDNWEKSENTDDSEYIMNVVRAYLEKDNINVLSQESTDKLSCINTTYIPIKN